MGDIYTHANKMRIDEMRHMTEFIIIQLNLSKLTIEHQSLERKPWTDVSLWQTFEINPRNNEASNLTKLEEKPT